MSNHGDANWATSAQLRNAGMLEQGAVYLGASYDNPNKGIFYNGDGHVLTVAPPGSGKSVAVAIPNLLFNPSSMVVTDPKGALTAQTARHRENMGQKVVVLNPWRQEMTDGLGRDLGDTGFNPLSILRAGDPALIDNAEMIATMLCPTPHDAKNPYWTDTGAAILTGCLLYLTHAAEEALTLPRLYSLVRDTKDGWKALAARMMEVEALDLDDYAAEILGPLPTDGQWAGVHGAILAATKIYNPQKPLAAHVARDEFDPASLKREPVTVYLVVPSNRREANKAWLALVMALCAEAVGRAGVASPVTLLCEEFANLGYMPTISRAMAEYREAGLRAHLVIQTPHQLTRLYGKDGAQEIINLCAVRQYFGVDDLETARQIEATIGTFTANARSYSDNPNIETKGFMPAFSTISTSQMAVPLARAQDILNMPEQEQIILVRGSVPPILAYVKPFYTDQSMIDATDANPYRNEPAQRQAQPFKTGAFGENLGNWPHWGKAGIAFAGAVALAALFWVLGEGFALWVFVLWWSMNFAALWLVEYTTRPRTHSTQHKTPAPPKSILTDEEHSALMRHLGLDKPLP